MIFIHKMAGVELAASPCVGSVRCHGVSIASTTGICILGLRIFD